MCLASAETFRLRFELVRTCDVVVGELLLFMGLLTPHFRTANFLAHPVPVTLPGVFAALPFAIWFYLAIEGVAMVAEEVENPRRTIPTYDGLWQSQHAPGAKSGLNREELDKLRALGYI